MSGLRKIRSKIVNVVKKLMRIPQNFLFAYTYRHLRHRRKIVYALTPPAILKNVGDHAQAIAIRAWLRKHYPELPVIEVDKNQSRYFILALRWLVQPHDVLFLHSGGNLGDRGMWSESIRRLLISTFTKNQIVSLPQTIYFSDAPIGRRERENTRRIYATHSYLTVIARDPRSGKIATELFPEAQTFSMPDFVLSLPSRQPGKKNNPPKILLCLRNDTESVLIPDQRKEISQNLPYEHVWYDTTLDSDIKVAERETILEDTLDLFCAHDAVITDRYHGLIFAVLCRKPCVVLQTVDHKLTSAMHWFKDVPFVAFAQDFKEIFPLVEKCLRVENREVPDWNAKYFDKIPKLIGDCRNEKYTGVATNED